MQQLIAFYGGLHRRIPVGNSDTATAARASIGQRLAALNAAMLKRDVDPRVTPDIDALLEMINDRLGRYDSSQFAPINDLAEQTMHAISSDLSSAPTGDDGADTGDGWGDND